MFGLSFEKLLIIGVLAVIVLGPQKLPYYASQLAKGVKWARGMLESAQGRMREEMGDEYDDVDWKKLDPRQYDPRRIIREALLDDPLSTAGADAEWTAASSPAASEGDRAATVRPATALSVAPREPARRAPRALSAVDAADATTGADAPLGPDATGRADLAS